MTKLVIGNMKMNLSLNEIKDYIEKLKYHDNVIICPTSIYIPYFVKYKVGIQNIFFKDAGSFTGEISPKQCQSLGVSYAIVGHSERRHYFGEDDTVVNQKLKQALLNNLKVILCIGEKENEDAKAVVKKQIEGSLKEVQTINDVIIAYEPVWAIGTNRIPTNSQIEETIAFIKDFIKKTYNTNLMVLYGGSVNEKNIKDLNMIPNVDGFLVGGASTKIDEFNKIIEVAVNE